MREEQREKLKKIILDLIKDPSYHPMKEKELCFFLGVPKEEKAAFSSLGTPRKKQSSFSFMGWQLGSLIRSKMIFFNFSLCSSRILLLLFFNSFYGLQIFSVKFPRNCLRNCMNSRFLANANLCFACCLSLDMRKSLHKMQAYHIEEINLPNNVQRQCYCE